jgi:uncharacterized protein (TIGR01732 family)
MQKITGREVIIMGFVAGGSCSCAGFTTTGVILVLFILLVIVSRAFVF